MSSEPYVKASAAAADNNMELRLSREDDRPRPGS